ncbi:HEAT repeat domain-containing protein [Fulvivirga sp. M361]|uniref:HEAT repeat domain-containing protein n=1 Tax=Fulvivirga sp. M361 TaxID=2594266 RepID=UPI001179D801|nr:HEAT repeat domain-containing protein [Fulvivirga sp. M361]TRX56196.1 HEAT repeat domain-containing protein [Fulvivirga sp. M361]
MEDKHKSLLIEYIAGNLDNEQMADLERLLAEDPEILREYEALKKLTALMAEDVELEPDSTLREDFLLEIERELDEIESNSTGQVKTIRFPLPWKIAASVAVIAISFFAGKWVWQPDEDQVGLAGLKEEIRLNRELVLSSLRDEHSASRRLNGAVSYTAGSPDMEIINTLIHVMNEDDNVNVRLAAVQALARFAEQPVVTAALLSALQVQSEAVVQISLINLMVDLHEKRAVGELQKIIDNDTALQVVRDEAHMAVFKLI